MKKLMLAVAIVCAAVMANAAAFQWQTKSTGSTGILYAGNTTDKAYGAFGAVELYLIDAASYTQSAAFADLVEGKFDTSKTIANTKLNTSSKISSTQVVYGETTSAYDLFWVALLDDSNFYVSSLKEDVSPLGTGAQKIEWADVQATSTAKLPTTTFAGAGLYETVPEPTSGLLLLLGMAGLALRRKQA